MKKENSFFGEIGWIKIIICKCNKNLYEYIYIYIYKCIERKSKKKRIKAEYSLIDLKSLKF